MSISGISSITDIHTVMQDRFKQMKDDMEKLGQDLQTGDLSGAKQIFSSLQKLLPSSSGNQPQASRQNTLANDANALKQALQAGDLSKAQDAYSTLQKDMQAIHKKHHHLHAAGTSSTSPDSTFNRAISIDESASGSAIKSIDIQT